MIKKTDVTVIICCAGMGTRLGIGTTKALVDVGGEPLIIRQLKLLDVKAWLCCSNMLPLRGEQQATDYNPAKAYIR